jgi:hypothetical protein
MNGLKLNFIIETLPGGLEGELPGTVVTFTLHSKPLGKKVRIERFEEV